MIPKKQISLLCLCIALSLTSAAQADQPICNVNVFIYQDVSLSLSKIQSNLLEEGIESLFNVNQEPTFPTKTNVYLIPFADTTETVEHKLEKVSEVRSDLEKTEELDGNKTDITKVFSNILAKTRALQSYTVFVIASDFEHDTRNDPRASAILDNFREWSSYFHRQEELLREAFRPGAPRALILLQTKNKRATYVASEVIKNIQTLNNGKGPIAAFDLEDNPFTKSKFLSYVDPLDVTISRTGLLGDNAVVTVTARNRLCTLPPKELYYQLWLRYKDIPYELTSPDKPLNLSPGQPDTWRDTSLIDKARLSRVPAEALTNGRYLALVSLQRGMPSDRRPMISNEIYVRDNVFLSHLDGIPDIKGTGFELTPIISGNLQDTKNAAIQLELFRGSEKIGDVEYKITDKDLATDQTHNKPFTLPIFNSQINKLCSDHDPRRRPVLRISGPDNILMPQRSDPHLVVDIGSYRNGSPEHLLHAIFEQTSIPAFITGLLAILLLFKRAGDIELVEKTLAVLAIITTTLVIALHHLTPLEGIIDDWIDGPRAHYIGACTAALFTLLIARILQLGGLPFSPTAYEVKAHIIAQDAEDRQRGSHIALRHGRDTALLKHWRRIVIPVVLILGGAMFFSILFDARDKVDCWFELSDDVTKYQAAEPIKH
jgi:hypothetical protein